jgi:hypothetical protein
MVDRLEGLRGHVTATIKDATHLLARLKSLDQAFQSLQPRLAAMTAGERDAYVARLCGYDEALPERLRDLVESLADVLAGLTTTDGGKAWLQHRTAQLEAGETAEAA